MDKSKRKGALDRKMEQSYQPDPSEQEKNYDAENGLEGAQGDSGASAVSEDTQKGGPEGSPAEEAGESPMDEMQELAQGVEEIMSSKTTDPKTKAIVAKLMEMLSGGAAGTPTGPTPPGQEDGQLSSMAGGKSATSMSM